MLWFRVGVWTAVAVALLAEAAAQAVPNPWSRISDVPYGNRSGAATAFLSDNVFYQGTLIGGITADGTLLDDIWVVTPGTGRGCAWEPSVIGWCNALPMAASLSLRCPSCVLSCAPWLDLCAAFSDKFWMYGVKKDQQFWQPRHSHVVLGFDGSMWVLGGLGAGGVAYADAWLSQQGGIWDSITVPWLPRGGHVGFVYPVRHNRAWTNAVHGALGVIPVLAEHSSWWLRTQRCAAVSVAWPVPHPQILQYNIFIVCGWGCCGGWPTAVGCHWRRQCAARVAGWPIGTQSLAVCSDLAVRGQVGGSTAYIAGGVHPNASRYYNDVFALEAPAYTWREVLPSSPDTIWSPRYGGALGAPRSLSARVVSVSPGCSVHCPVARVCANPRV